VSAAALPPADAALEAPVNVLLVDDRADKLLALESILANDGVRVTTARSGQEALRALLHAEFAVILLDVNMPLLDGFETASLIRGRPSTEKTPIIFMTAASDLEAGMSRGYALGAVDYIQMPVQPDVLRAKVKVFVELYRRREQVREQAERRRLREQREHAQRLAEAADRLDFETRRNRFFTLAPDMLGIAGLDGRLRQLNQSWQHTLGFSAEELCARPIVEFLHPADRHTVTDRLRELAEGAPTARFENRHRHVDGSYRWLSWTAAAFHEEGLVYVFARDITFRKVAEEGRLQLVREQEARRAAERQNELKDQFLATLSHELRSPLTPILGWVTMLRSEQVGSAETAHALEVIERNARLQAQLVEDLLDVSRIMSGKLRIEPAPIDLRSVVERGLDAVRGAAHKRRIELSVELGAEPVRVLADPERLQQVVWNLGANAVKFSAEGGAVEVKIEVDGELARLRVRDDGVGMSAEFLPHAFEHFQQASSGSTRTHGGLGLGLAIVSHIVQAHGGSVSAESAGIGRGATITVALPLASDAASEPLRAEAGATAAGDLAAGLLHGRKLLVVDDEPDVRDMLARVLELEGAAVATAASVPEALELIDSQRPDLVVSDIGMAGEDGYALVEHVRGLDRDERPIPVVAVTAYATAQDVARISAAGFRAHLAKPVDPRTVVSTLVAALEEESPAARRRPASPR
jgi:PAS domain S-box-containing protein